MIFGRLILMPVIKLEYDDNAVSDVDVKIISEAIRGIVIRATGIQDVFVYANTAKIKVQVAPIEIFVEMSAHKIDDVDKLLSDIKAKLKEWKKHANFKHLINLTLTPMNWKIELGI